MPRIANSTIEEVNARTDIVSLIGEYTRLEKRGSDYWGCCPFHNEKTASFHVIPDTKLYYCFGCHAGGSTIKFYQEMEKVTFHDAVIALAKKGGIEVVFDNNADNSIIDSKEATKDLYKELYSRVAGSYKYILHSTPQGEFAKNYLLSRGITLETAEKFSLGYSPKDSKWLRNFLESKSYSKDFLDESGLFSKKFPSYSFFTNRLMFPIWDRNGKVVAFGGRLLEGDGPKYLNSGDLIQYKKGETLYAFYLAKKSIRESKTAILCEGYMDVIAYHQAGITNAVAPLGTALTEDQLKILHSFVDTLLLSFDTDEAGQKATWKAILMARRLGFTVKIINLSNGKDPCEILQNFGVETLTNFVNSAILDGDFLLSKLAKKYDITTPEGKIKASLEFFQYVDVLQSGIQKDSCLEQLASSYQLTIKSVKADYENRDIAKRKINSRNTTEQVQRLVKPNAELRALLAVISNVNFFPMMRTSLNADDFEDPLAKDMFITLEECYREELVNYDSILQKLQNEQLKNMVAQAVATGEFAINTEKTIEDSIKQIHANGLRRKQKSLLSAIEQMQTVPQTLQVQQELASLVNEKMSIDNELRYIKDKN